MYCITTTLCFLSTAPEETFSPTLWRAVLTCYAEISVHFLYHTKDFALIH